jgi:hypothetical protein
MPVISKRVVVVVNKWWECDPVMNVLLHAKARPGNLAWPTVLNHPHPRPTDLPLPPQKPSFLPRAVYTYPAVDVEIWCISDLLEDLPDLTRFGSSSQRKAEALLRVFNGRFPDLVIAVGTAAFPTDSIMNGSVAVGTRAFIYNPNPDGKNPYSNWSVGPFETVIESAVSADVFAKYVGDKSSVPNRFARTPNNPAPVMDVLADQQAVAVGSVNVTDYRQYDDADRDAMNSFYTNANGAPALSLETTHGLIRAVYGVAKPDSDSRTALPFMFISGITDRIGHFAQDVGANEYAQNFVASHNMGVVLASIIPNVVDQLSAS